MRHSIENYIITYATATATPLLLLLLMACLTSYSCFSYKRTFYFTKDLKYIFGRYIDNSVEEEKDRCVNQALFILFHFLCSPDGIHNVT